MSQAKSEYLLLNTLLFMLHLSTLPGKTAQKEMYPVNA